MPAVLVVDDEPVVRKALQSLLGGLELEVSTAEDGIDARGKLRGARYDLVITDLKMPRADGFEVIRAVREVAPGTPVVMLTGHGSVQDCVAAMRAGAANFISKPFHPVELEQIVRDLLARPKKQAGGGSRPQVMLVGTSPRLQEVLALIERVAATDATVLITGETGTGKEVAARLVHGSSERAGRPFVAVNCGAIPEGLIESELFGHARGAYTGATEKRIGRFAQADGGTLFLDEIGDLPLALQVKLLRVLQEREVTPVGESQPVSVDVRVIAATHRDLESMVAAGGFREDLFYRLNVVEIPMPSLRERPEDVPLLADTFLRAAAERHGRRLALAPETADALIAYHWPGNVRELENLMEKLAIVAPGETIALADVPQKLRSSGRAGALADAHLTEAGIDLPATLAAIERRLIDEAMRLAGGNKNRAAQLLGINRTTLVEKLKRR